MVEIDERRYTLDEARTELHRLECGQMGHDYDIISIVESNRPIQVICLRCGVSWKIAYEETP